MFYVYIFWGLNKREGNTEFLTLLLSRVLRSIHLVIFIMVATKRMFYENYCRSCGLLKWISVNCP